MMTPAESNTLSNNTKVTLGVVIGSVASLATVIGVGWTVASKVLDEAKQTRTEFTEGINSIRAEMTDLRRDVKSLSDNKWTESQMAEWALRFRAANDPRIIIPDPRDLSRMLPSNRSYTSENP